ncbi:NMDA receptor-regulated protein 1-domain-containing protein [Mycena floridula]|nr:NMDA receptor-regulated protein 1-domain-containing protein [Mycena floridula]
MSKASATPAAKRQLPSKEATLFKELLNLYETRQLKKGVKTADLILKKFPEHGETLCMKGIIFTHMGRRDEGIVLAKKGLRLDMSSHICWHVFGLIQKAEKNYEEALKSYGHALKADKDNLNILRDAAQLQTQLRMFDALVETRHILLRLRPTWRQHWVALAVAYHLSGNLVEAKKVLENYESTLKNVPDYDLEHSETLLYHVRLLEEMGEFSEALSLLDISAKQRAIVDKTAIMEIRASLLTKIGSEEAEHAWRVLVEHNPDCYEYFQGYLNNVGVSADENAGQALEILRDFSSQLPRSMAARRMALTVAQSTSFKDLVKPYLLSAFNKGIPSIFVDIKALYKDPAKMRIIQDIVEAARAENDPGSSSPSSSSTVSPDPTVYLWVLYFLAQHYSYLGQHIHALEILELAIAHTPSLPELFTCKARILKRLGDFYGAARQLDEARLLDGQDRFLNTKCAKYRLRAGLLEEVGVIIGLFTKKDAVSPSADLEDMQSLLYIMEEANAYNRQGKLNMALKKYVVIQQIFAEIEDDQFDFHGYSLRKFIISIYVSLLKWEDRLRSHPAYGKAAIEASKIFVAVHDDPTLAKVNTATAQLTEAEKKAKKKAKKAAQKIQEDLKKNTNAASTEDKSEAQAPKDDDPDGLKLISCEDPLERAAKLLNPLPNLIPNDINMWMAFYDVSIRRKKTLQAIKALNHARALDPQHPELHIRAVDFRQRTLTVPAAPIGPLVSETLAQLLPDEISLETFNSQYLQRHSRSAASIIAAAKVAKSLETARDEVGNILFTTLGEGVDLTIQGGLDIIGMLSKLKSPRENEFRVACDKKFERSTVFKSAEEQVVLRAQAIAPPPIVDPDASG